MLAAPVPTKSQFARRPERLLVAFTASSVDDDELLARNADDNIPLYTRLVQRDHYQFRMAPRGDPIYDVATNGGYERRHRVLFFLRPVDDENDAFPWEIGAELRLFDAYTFDAVVRARVDAVSQHRRAQRLDATGYVEVTL